MGDLCPDCGGSIQIEFVAANPAFIYATGLLHPRRWLGPRPPIRNVKYRAARVRIDTGRATHLEADATFPVTPSRCPVKTSFRVERALCAFAPSCHARGIAFTCKDIDRRLVASVQGRIRPIRGF
jgi:hypothetical protein